MKGQDLSSDEQLKKKISEFVQIAEQLPEIYRRTCFAVLLNQYLQGREPPSQRGLTQEVVPSPSPKYTIPIDVKAFLTQYKLAEDSVGRLFLSEGGEIRPIYQIKKKNVKADAQMQVAVLTALENALKPDGKFEFSIEDVRKYCVNQGVYDSTNFMTNFKKNSRLFRNLKEKDHIELSPEGKTELAEAVSAILE